MFILISQVFLVTLISSTIAELPPITYDTLEESNQNSQPSSSYDAPGQEISSGYGAPHQEVSSSYGVPLTSHESSSSTGLDLEKQPIGYQTSEGLEIDSTLLHKIKEILLEHENSAASSSISAPSSSYGVPQSSYGPPSHWSSPSSNVVDIHFDQWTQSIPVAQYIARKRYATNVDEGWNSGSNVVNSGWNAGNSGWESGSSSNSEWNIPSQSSSGWQQQSNGWTQQRAVEAAGWTTNSASSGWDAGQLSPPRWQ